MDRNDPYLVLLRRELTRALAQLKRAERERDRALATVARLRRGGGNAVPSRVTKRVKRK